MNPNHYLAVAIDYLYRTRTEWRKDAAVGKTLVSSSIIDRVAESLGRRLWEVPVGFKWFVPGLIDGSVGFGGEESAGASFLRFDGTAWTTDKDGILLALLASEIRAVTGKSPSQLYARADRAVRRPGLRAGGCAGESRSRRPPSASSTATRSRRPSSRASRSPRSSAARPATTRPLGGVKVQTANGLVRRPAERHRERLQDLRRVVRGRRQPARGAGGGQAHRRRRARRLTHGPSRASGTTATPSVRR